MARAAAFEQDGYRHSIYKSTLYGCGLAGRTTQLPNIVEPSTSTHDQNGGGGSGHRHFRRLRRRYCLRYRLTVCSGRSETSSKSAEPLRLGFILLIVG